MSWFRDTQREAKGALVAARRHEDAYRAEVRVSPPLESLGPHRREYPTTGKPVLPRRSRRA